MSDKVYMTHLRSTFACPKCRRKTPVDLSTADRPKTKGISLTCACGYEFITALEKRRHYRKPVNFKGRYRYSTPAGLGQGDGKGKFVGKGKMQVVDVSAWGLKMKLKKKEAFRVNDQLSVEFHLDDKEKTMIQEQATIRNIDDRTIGGAFFDQRKGNRHLGFYLLG